MRERLEVLWNLLSPEGSLWISIDDDEMPYLRVLMDGLVGRDRFIAQNVWQKRYSRENREAIGDVHEYVVVYAKDPPGFKERRNKVGLTDEQAKVYKNPNNDPKGRWRPIPMTAQEGHATAEQFYEIVAPGGKDPQAAARKVLGPIEEDLREAASRGSNLVRKRRELPTQYHSLPLRG